MDRMEQIKDLTLRVEDLAAMAGLRRWDRVKLMYDPDELCFLWEDEKLAIAVELDIDVSALADVFAQSTNGLTAVN